ncbi:MAG: hypothetical protein AOA65_0666 [Candidatus Bathyarchaeota archaeon BA1]|nr:MAG: hypothetical protein AOA65_0666 [Candidatus Bathyarchaeota archaeon BA1]
MTKHRSEKTPANLDKLIEMEWDILRDLKRMLQNPELSTAEKIRAANALAYHASVLNKLLSQKGESSQFNDASLGDFIQGVQPRIARLAVRDFRAWTKRLSLTR